jgi:hypothetical protein
VAGEILDTDNFARIGPDPEDDGIFFVLVLDRSSDLAEEGAQEIVPADGDGVFGIARRDFKTAHGSSLKGCGGKSIAAFSHSSALASAATASRIRMSRESSDR